MHLGKIHGVGGGIHPPNNLNLKKGIRTSDYQSSKPLQSLYEHFYVKSLYVPWHNLQPLWLGA